MDTRTPNSHSSAPGYPTRGSRPVPMAPEDGGTTSGPAGASTPTTPAATTTATTAPTAVQPAASTAKPAEAQAQPPEQKTEAEKAADKLRFKRTDKAAPKADKGPTLADVMARMSALEQALESSRSEATTAATAVREQRLAELLTQAEVLPKYHRLLRADLAGVDPLTDAGKAKFDTIIAATKKDFPEAFAPKAPLPDSAWVKRLEDRQKATGTDQARRGRSLLDTMSPDSLASMTGGRK